MTVGRVDHLGIAVRSIDEALGIYRALGLEVAHREVVENQGVATAFLHPEAGQGVLLELSEDPGQTP